MAKENENEITLEETLKQIQKMFGKGSVMKLGDRQPVDVDVIPSGSLLLDEALGLGQKSRFLQHIGNRFIEQQYHRRVERCFHKVEGQQERWNHVSHLRDLYVHIPRRYDKVEYHHHRRHGENAR